ncbi:MAG: hypothetical protein H6679_01080 [Epsilonproteobacteria bacterium]|nr:hypothetical protein [Campylobacterota bacterium]
MKKILILVCTVLLLGQTFAFIGTPEEQAMEDLLSTPNNQERIKKFIQGHMQEQEKKDECKRYLRFALTNPSKEDIPKSGLTEEQHTFWMANVVMLYAEIMMASFDVRTRMQSSIKDGSNESLFCLFKELLMNIG